MKISDDVVIFPLFDSHPGEPEFICCENFALRNEFEGWYLRDRVAQKVRDFWIQTCHKAGFFSILAENGSFLVAKSTTEDRILFIVLNYVFYVDFKEATWKRFEELVVTTEKGDTRTTNKGNLSWDIDTTKCKLTLQIRDVRKDSITIPIAEWRSLRDLISAKA